MEYPNIDVACYKIFSIWKVKAYIYEKIKNDAYICLYKTSSTF